MTPIEAALVEVIEQEFFSCFVIFLRVTPLFFFIPAFGEQSLPVRVKLALAICISISLLPVVELNHNSAFFVHYFFSEAAIGTVIGIGFRILIWSLQIAGSIAAQTTSLAQLVGSGEVDPMPAIGHVLQIAGITIFLVLELHLRAIELLASTYQTIPIGTPITPGYWANWNTVQVSKAFALAFQMSGPFIIMSIIYNLTMGAVNKAMPHLMVAFVGAPLITFGALLVLAISSPVIIEVWAATTRSFLNSPFE